MLYQLQSGVKTTARRAEIYFLTKTTKRDYIKIALNKSSAYYSKYTFFIGNTWKLSLGRPHVVVPRWQLFVVVSTSQKVNLKENCHQQRRSRNSVLYLPNIQLTVLLNWRPDFQLNRLNGLFCWEDKRWIPNLKCVEAIKNLG